MKNIVTCWFRCSSFLYKSYTITNAIFPVLDD